MVDVDIELDFGLCATGAHADEMSAFQSEIEHIACRIGEGCHFACLDVGFGATKDIKHAFDGDACNFFGWIFTHARHDLAHHFDAVNARQGGGLNIFEVVTEGVKNFVHHIAKGFALGAIVSGGFGDEQGSVHAVLVANEGGGQEAVAFFKAKEEGMRARIFENLDLFADKFEPCEGVKNGNIKMIADGFGKLSRHDALEHCAICGQCPLFFFATKNVVEHEATDLIARQQAEIARRRANGDTQAVTIGVSAKDGICAHFVCKLNGEGEGIGIFGVRHFDGGKMRIGVFLFFDNAHVGDADFVQDATNGHISAPMQGGVDDLEFAAYALHHFGIDGKGFDACDVFVVHFRIADDVKQSRLQRFFHGDMFGFGEGKGVDGIGDSGRNFGANLRAIFAIDLVAVILGRVMARGDHNACDGIQMTNAKAQKRNGTKGIKQVRFDAVCTEDQGGLGGKLGAHQTAVVSDHYATISSAINHAQIVGKPLCGTTHRIDVHTVHASTEHATHTCCAKAQIAIEAVFLFLFVLCNGEQVFLQFGVVCKIFEPRIIVLLITHDCPSLGIMYWCLNNRIRERCTVRHSARRVLWDDNSGQWWVSFD